MAHHASTPKTVLDAPTRTVDVVGVPVYLTRTERRHGVNVSGIREDDDKDRYLRSLRRGLNPPARLAEPRRGRKVKRGRTVEPVVVAQAPRRRSPLATFMRRAGGAR